MLPTIRAYDARTERHDDLPRTIVATINTDAVDSYRTVIVPKGGRFEKYTRNPVVLCNHDQDRVVGRNVWLKSQARSIKAATQFLPPDLDPEADKLRRMYEEGYLFGFSIRFEPISYGAPTQEELKKNPAWRSASTIFREWDLVEYSAVTIPSNPDALADAVRRGYCRPEWVQRAKAMQGICSVCGEEYVRDEDQAQDETRCPRCRDKDGDGDQDEPDGDEMPDPAGIPREAAPVIHRPSEHEILALCRLKMPALISQIVRDAQHLARGRV